MPISISISRSTASLGTDTITSPSLTVPPALSTKLSSPSITLMILLPSTPDPSLALAMTVMFPVFSPVKTPVELILASPVSSSTDQVTDLLLASFG